MFLHPSNYLILFVFKAKKPMNYVDCYSFTFSVPKISISSNAWKMVADLGTFDGFMLEFTMFIY